MVVAWHKIKTKQKVCHSIFIYKKAKKIKPHTRKVVCAKLFRGVNKLVGLWIQSSKLRIESRYGTYMNNTVYLLCNFLSFLFGILVRVPGLIPRSYSICVCALKVVVNK